jgi:hypothetical protein
MMTIDLAKLAGALSKAEPEMNSSITERDINPYLLEHVILPYLSGRNVMINDLDFLRFTTVDIDTAKDEIHDAAQTARQSLSLAQMFRQIHPSTGKTKSFC